MHAMDTITIYILSTGHYYKSNDQPLIIRKGSSIGSMKKHVLRVQEERYHISLEEQEDDFWEEGI